MKNKTLERIVHGVFLILGLLTVGCVLLITVYLVISGIPAIQEIRLFDFLFGTEWASTAETPEYGILPFILTSVYGTAGAITLGVPIGFFAAVYLSKFAHAKVKAFMEGTVSLLAGIPSVVYGLVGMLVLVPGIRTLFDVPVGASLFAAIQLLGAEADCTGKDFLTIERRTEISSAIENAVSMGHSEIRIRRNDREYQLDISRIETGGEKVGTVILCFDITEQANAERLRREFSANVSHELKTPLQSISGSAELIENGLVKQEDLPRFVGHIREEASRLIRLVEDIIKLSQLDEGTEMPTEKVPLLALSKEVCSIIADSAREKAIDISVSGDEGCIRGVKQLLFEVIYNLCDNAVKYNKNGGKVQIKIAEETDWVTLTVSDTGIGIPTEHQQRVFERFYRVDKSHLRKSGGTGLGLSIVKHGVILHKGKITLNSDENQGTEITVVFPKTA